MADVPGARVIGHISIVSAWKELVFYTTSIMTAKVFCGTVRYRIMKSGAENRFGKGKETWQH